MNKDIVYKQLIRIAKNIVSVNQSVRQNTFKLWKKINLNKTNGIKLPENITNSNWVKHHLKNNKKMIDDSSSVVSTKFVENLIKKIDNNKLLNGEQKKFLDELNTIVYIPKEYHNFFNKYVKQGNYFTIDYLYRFLNFLLSFENKSKKFGNIKQAIDSINSLINLLPENNKENYYDAIIYQLNLIYNQIYNDIFKNK